MGAKITFISPPDIYQNNKLSLFLIDPDEKDQDQIADWLKTQDDLDINLYYYQGETNAPWLLHSLAVAKYKYINVDNMSAMTSYLVSYILSKSGCYYKTKDTNIGELFSHLNHNRVQDAQDFLRQIFDGQDQSKQL
jgi:hypothetical protein